MPLLKHLLFQIKQQNNKFRNCKLTLSGRPWPVYISYYSHLKGKR